MASPAAVSVGVAVFLLALTADSWAREAQRTPSPVGPVLRSRRPSPPGSPSQGRARPDRRRTPAGSPNATYDYFVLSQQWSPGVCAADSQCVSASKRNYWTIHGLWPSGNYTSPSYCLDERFNGHILDPIKRDLNKYWPSLTHAEARYFAFWRHQWQKHGSCAADVPKLNGIFNFFNSTLAIYHKYNIFDFLANSYIRPSDREDFLGCGDQECALGRHQAKSQTSSVKRVPNVDGPVLTGIRFCLDKELATVNCQGRNGGCTKRNYYLPKR
uniref:Putative ribonuclease ddi-like protein n=2 Tax=Ixodes ricinus TaxID=34613 RepID=A0A090XEE0_IXORI